MIAVLRIKLTNERLMTQRESNAELFPADKGGTLPTGEQGRFTEAYLSTSKNLCSFQFALQYVIYAS